ARTEHPRLPASAGTGEAVDADLVRQLCDPPNVGLQRGDLRLRAEADVDVLDAVVVELDGELRRLDADRGEQLAGRFVRADLRQRLLHPAEDDTRAVPLEPHRDDPDPALEPDLVELQRRRQYERGPERRMAGERKLDQIGRAHV